MKNGNIRVLFASSEAEPFYKVGGLGDYSGSLPNALANLSLKSGNKIDIRVVLPLHDLSTINAFSLSEEFSISFDSRSEKVTGAVYSALHNGITYYFIRQIKPKILSTDVYDSNQYTNAFKFAFFSLACIKMLSNLDWQPDILHANDWHSALIINQLDHSQTVNDKGKKIRTALAIHNMPFMGSGSEKMLQNFGINPISINTIPEWAQYLPLPMGIVSADKIVAVSPTYAEELKTNYFAYGLENYFIDNAEKLTGIINGIDTQQWDPSTDKFILQNFIEELERMALAYDFNIDFAELTDTYQESQLLNGQQLNEAEEYLIRNEKNKIVGIRYAELVEDIMKVYSFKTICHVIFLVNI